MFFTYLSSIEIGVRMRLVKGRKGHLDLFLFIADNSRRRAGIFMKQGFANALVQTGIKRRAGHDAINSLQGILLVFFINGGQEGTYLILAEKLTNDLDLGFAGHAKKEKSKFLDYLHGWKLVSSSF